MKNLFILLSIVLISSCSAWKSYQNKKKGEELVALPFGKHDLLMAMKDSAFVNDCLMSDPTFYLKHIDDISSNNVIKLDERKLVKFPKMTNLNIRNHLGSKSSFLICIDPTGRPRFSKFIRSNTDDAKYLNKLHQLTLDFKYEERQVMNCLECGKFTFNFSEVK